MKIDFADIIKNSFYLLFKDDVVLMVAIIYAIIAFLVGFFYLGTSVVYNTIMPVISAPVGALYFLVAILMVLLLLYLNGLVFIRINKKLRGKRLYNEALRRFPSLLGTSILEGIIIGLGLIAFIIPGIYLAIKLVMAGPIAVLNDKNPIDALKDSWDATTGNWWEIFATVLVIGIIVSIIGLIPYVSNFIAFAGTIALALIFGSLFKKKASTRSRKKKR